MKSNTIIGHMHPIQLEPALCQLVSSADSHCKWFGPRSGPTFSIFRQYRKNSRKIKFFNTFENIMENGAFAPKDPLIFLNMFYFKGIKRCYYGVKG